MDEVGTSDEAIPHNLLSSLPFWAASAVYISQLERLQFGLYYQPKICKIQIYKFSGLGQLMMYVNFNKVNRFSHNNEIIKLH
ncbi:uncharacterized protein OCT59_018959 [Rhizophagus irregularis]|uniref:uncharacterized protein n=1 Tax=Rhizophagus irregularis TaxID=588596 RepID=UPI003322D783|nr:hypothetical protein OCT59_018959 [Rhizophagus irregularis]